MSIERYTYITVTLLLFTLLCESACTHNFYFQGNQELHLYRLLMHAYEFTVKKGRGVK